MRWVCDPWTITQYTVGGAPMFALWRGEDRLATKYHRDRDELMSMARELETQAECLGEAA